MIVYDKDKITKIEMDDNDAFEKYNKGEIVEDELFIAHHIIPENEKRPYKSAETIFNELNAQGVPVEIHNGIYCKIVGNTYEAINEQTEIDDYDEYERIFVLK